MKKKISELRFDLDSIRAVKRQLNRTLRYVTAIEKGMLKFKREENKRKAESKRKRREPPPLAPGTFEYRENI